MQGNRTLLAGAVNITADQSLGEIATRIPAASRVFRSMGLDYCCRGKRSVSEACSEAGLDPAAVLQSIQATEPEPESSWESKPLPALVAHIVDRYHDTLRRELPELCEMAATVEQKHAAKPSCPHGLAMHLHGIHEAVLSHLEKEEGILFPMILAGHGARAGGPIQVMEMEHEEHGANLARTRALTSDLVAPPEACPTWQALYARLRELETDLMDHIALENNVLFPRALCE